MFSSGNDPNGTVLPIQLQRNYHLLPDKLPDCSVAEHRRESEPQLTGKDSKDGLAFRAFPEMRFLPIQKLKILTERLRLGLIEQAECFDVKSVRHGVDLSTGMDGQKCL